MNQKVSNEIFSKLNKGLEVLKILFLAFVNQYDYINKKFTIGEISNVRKLSVSQYVRISEKIYKNTLGRLKQQKKIKVAFVVYSAAMWSCDELYKLFQRDDKFEPYVIVSRFRNDSDLNTFPTYKKTLEYFEKNNFDVKTVPLEMADDDCWKYLEQPDIMFYLTPYDSLIPYGLNLEKMPASVLSIYIPYSYMLSNSEVKYDAPGMAMTWRHFCDSNLYRNILINYRSEYRNNTYYVGYPKMDIYYEVESKSKKNIWKMPKDSSEDNVKCIIYAPHHSLRGYKKLTSNFSTFEDNYMAFYELAKKYSDETSWIIKPHPNLKMTAVESGLFKNDIEYEAYLKSWDDLPNAKVVEESTYYDIFKTSDALIGDSVSFLAEYQFTHKPILLLTRKEQQFNAFGDIIREILYKTPGEDIVSIDNFIQEVIINNNDYMKNKRDLFFSEYLDYRLDGNPSASEQIYTHILEQIYNLS